MSEHDLESALVALMIFGAPVCGIGAFWAWRIARTVARTRQLEWLYLERIARLRAGRRP
jgi:hypothetical protein